jgi:hypothetical protein
MTLLSDALRVVFDSGETLATISPSVAAVLTRRDAALAQRISNLRVLASDRLAVDPHVRPTGPARVWSERLPATHQDACDLVAALGR